MILLVRSIIIFWKNPISKHFDYNHFWNVLGVTKNISSSTNTFIEKSGKRYISVTNQVTFTCSKSTIETVEKGVKYIES